MWERRLTTLSAIESRNNSWGWSMKWYFGLSEASIDRRDHGWKGLVRAAVTSARQATNLVPHLIYDGKRTEFINELEDSGVKIIFHRVSFYDVLETISAKRPGYLDIASGAFLRVEIRLIECEDKYILYTDCDVLFVKELRLESLTPEYFAAAPQFDIQNYDTDMNTGVLLMNLESLRRSLGEFTSFIVNNLNAGWPGFDQEHYRRFYKGQYDRLPQQYNWKPYWGVNEDAHIIHWHGPKPQVIRKLNLEQTIDINVNWKKFYLLDPRSYGHYLRLWDTISATTSRAFFGYLDLLTKNGGAGWILDQEDHLRPVIFYVAVDGECIARVENTIERSDLKRLYDTVIGGFEFKLPKQAKDDKKRLVTIHDNTGERIRLKHNSSSLKQFWI